MKLQAAVQEALVALLCYDQEAGAQVITMVEGRDFDPVYREIAEMAIEYRQRHGSPPGEHTLDLFDALKERNPSREAAFDQVFSSVEHTATEINPAFIVERAAAFVRYQRFMNAIQRALRDLSRGDEEGLDAAEAVIASALKQTAPTFRAGTYFAEDLAGSTRFLEEPEASFPTGIPEFDRRGLGPVRGRLHLLMAASSKGKSWWLIHLAAEAWKHGLSVLYVTFELSEVEVSQRLTQRSLSMTKRPLEDLSWEEFIESQDPADAGLRTRPRKMGKRPSFADRGAAVHVRKSLRGLASQARILIRDFPQGTMSVQQLDDFLTVLSERDKFMPQLLLVDYADIMKRASGMDRWEALIEIFEGLRSVAQRRHIAVATVGQVKHSAIKAKRVDVEHTSGAWDKVATADTVITYSQTDEEERRGMARLLVAKARTEEGRFSVLISQSYATGQFVMDSTRIGSNYGET